MIVGLLLESVAPREQLNQVASALPHELSPLIFPRAFELLSFMALGPSTQISKQSGSSLSRLLLLTKEEKYSAFSKQSHLI